MHYNSVIFQDRRPTFCNVVQQGSTHPLCHVKPKNKHSKPSKPIMTYTQSFLKLNAPYSAWLYIKTIHTLHQAKPKLYHTIQNQIISWREAHSSIGEVFQLFLQKMQKFKKYKNKNSPVPAISTKKQNKVKIQKPKRYKKV